jgi:outer membrane biosynthesis protein TonB
MITSPKKRLYLIMGVMFILILGLLWHAGHVMQSARSVRKQGQPAEGAALSRKIVGFGTAVAHAADTGQPSLVRKKLPQPAPVTPAEAEPPPAPAAPAAEPAVIETEKTQAAAPPEPAPQPSAPLPDLVSAPPVKLEPPKPEKKPLTETGGAYPFSILLSSCKEKENALATLSGLRQPGLTPYIVQTDLGSKGRWWRTLVGHYRTPGEAAQAKNALKLPNALVVKTPFANLLGQYGTEAEAGEAAARFAPKDIFPYTVKGPGNSFQLMAGAFEGQQAAAIYQRELEAKGISARVIQR